MKVEKVTVEKRQIVFSNLVHNARYWLKNALQFAPEDINLQKVVDELGNILDRIDIRYVENNRIITNTYQSVPDRSVVYKISFIPNESSSGVLNNVDYEPKEEKRQFTSLTAQGRLIIEISSVDSSTGADAIAFSCSLISARFTFN